MKFFVVVWRRSTNEMHRLVVEGDYPNAWGYVRDALKLAEEKYGEGFESIAYGHESGGAK